MKARVVLHELTCAYNVYERKNFLRYFLNSIAAALRKVVVVAQKKKNKKKKEINKK